MNLKNIIRNLLNFFHLDLTKNLEYDRLTKIILKKVINSNSNCIDVGCHKGEILDVILHYAPNGKHFAFEPIPDLFNNLKTKYKNKNLKVYSCALSDTTGESTFNYVKNAPAYSGIKKRKYNTVNPDIKEIKVELNKLDNLIPDSINIDLIKIDVEGAEYKVLKGGFYTLKRCKPLIIFEFGLGASDFYGTKPEEIYKLLNDAGLRIKTLKSFIKNKKDLSIQNFTNLYNSNKEYYFIAS